MLYEYVCGTVEEEHCCIAAEYAAHHKSKHMRRTSEKHDRMDDTRLLQKHKPRFSCKLQTLPPLCLRIQCETGIRGKILNDGICPQTHIRTLSITPSCLILSFLKSSLTSRTSIGRSLRYSKSNLYTTRDPFR